MNDLCMVDKRDLIEVWKILEMLTVSIDRLGSFEIFHGEEAAKNALHDFIGAEVSERIAIARRIISSALRASDPSVGYKLEIMAENEEDIGYWNGPKESK